MRLTLRTLLAYLDDILEPQDSEDIAKKIEESEFATELVHRTRDCMRRLRLGVPPVVGKGLASDANTVAEYLDNTLTTDRVPEFEKICLESDVHLAEVASCHQILTLVLGEPAEIDARSRSRMYQVAAEADAPPVQVDAMRPAAAAMVASAPSVQTASSPPAPPRRPKPEVPDYLREPRSRFWPIAAAAVVGALVTVGVLVMLAPAEWRQRVTAMDADEEAADETQATAKGQSSESAAGPAGAAPAGQSSEQTDATPPASADAAAEGSPSGPATELEHPATDGVDDSAPPAPEPGDTPADMPAEADASKPAAGTEQTPANVAAARPAASPDAPTTDTPAEPPAAEAPSDSTPADGSAPEMPEPAGADAGTPSGDVPAAPAGSGAGDAAFGRYTTQGGEVLLRFDRESGDWKRLPPMSPLAKGDRLLSLPLFRPSIALSTSINLQPDGAAELALSGWTAEGVPIVAIEHGRLLMMTVGKAGNSIQLSLGDYHVELTFVDAESTVALEARRVLSPGTDPTLATAPLAVDLYVTSGAVRVRLDNGPPVDLQAPMRRALAGDGLAPAGEVPSWVTSEALSDFDRRAKATLDPLLPPDQFAGLILKELSTDRRREVSSLAIRSAACLGNFEPCIEALSEKVEKSFWSSYIEELQSAIALSPEMAKRVSNAFSKLRGTDGPALFRMLWGYTAEDLQGGAAADLVESLNHDSLDHRVLAIWNLQDITGPANYGYYPENLARSRTVAVNRWKERLRQGKIVPRGAERPKASAKP